MGDPTIPKEGSLLITGASFWSQILNVYVEPLLTRGVKVRVSRELRDRVEIGKSELGQRHLNSEHLAVLLGLFVMIL